jgi:Protein of unknown function (DUF4019)
MRLRALFFVLTFGAGAVQAQLQPPADMGGTPSRPQGAPTTPAAPAVPAAPAADPATAAKEAAAANAAGEWLKLIDGAEYGKAWDESAPVFRERVTRQQWVEGLPKNRSEFGAFKSRTMTGTAYRASIPGAPEGEFVMVRFTSDFEKNPAGEEVVTMMLQAGAWRPLGYLLR